MANAAKAPRRKPTVPARPVAPAQPVAPVATKVSTMETYATIYNSTHTCDLSKIDGGAFEASEIKCLYSPGIVPDRAQFTLSINWLTWVFQRDGKVSGKNSEGIRIYPPNSSGHRGLCKMRAQATSMTCNDDMASCATVGYFGVNNSTGKMEMIYPSARLTFCRGADAALVEQVIVLEKSSAPAPTPTPAPVEEEDLYNVEKPR